MDSKTTSLFPFSAVFKLDEDKDRVFFCFSIVFFCIEVYYI